MNKDDVFYDLDGAERLCCQDKNEAIEMIIDKYGPGRVPKTIELVKFKRKEVDINKASLAEDVLEYLHEKIDEEYGDPEEPSDTTREMAEGASEFVKKYLAEYVPWMCEKESSETINCEKWVKENAPEWIEEGLKFED